jgi:hypothetical protein
MKSPGRIESSASEGSFPAPPGVACWGEPVILNSSAPDDLERCRPLLTLLLLLDIWPGARVGSMPLERDMFNDCIIDTDSAMATLGLGADFVLGHKNINPPQFYKNSCVMDTTLPLGRKKKNNPPPANFS